MSSTRKASRRHRPASNWPGGDAAAAAADADAAAVPGEAVAHAAAVAAAASQLDVAAPAKAGSRSYTLIDISSYGRVLVDPARSAFVMTLAAGAANNVDKRRHAG